MRSNPVAPSLAEVYYPESDGKPMAETDFHWTETVELAVRLKARYGSRSDVYVASDLFLYYVEGDASAVVAPDVFVVFGVPQGPRRIYKLWVEGVPPAVVFEITSRGTRREDVRTKRDLYARLGVAEYYLFDPEADYLRPPLQGFQLVDSAYVPMVPDASGSLNSVALGLDMRLDAELQLELFDIATGLPLLRLPEQSVALAQAEAEAATARLLAEQAAAEAAQLRAELERLRSAAQGDDAG
jgi:Uma2 family endonuclease